MVDIQRRVYEGVRRVSRRGSARHYSSTELGKSILSRQRVVEVDHQDSSEAVEVVRNRRHDAHGSSAASAARRWN